MCAYMVALACSILGSGIGGDENKLSSNISSEDVEFFFSSVCCLDFFLRQNLSLRM
jgi:hypothetical protein